MQPFDMSQKEVPTNLEELVHRAMDNAVENGHKDFMLNGDLEEVACDLHDLDSELNGIDTANIMVHVESWRQKQKG